jgi:hypothetical protein
MKILALSNVEGVLEQVTDALSETKATIMGKELSGDTTAFCDAAYDALTKKNYDLVIGITDDYIAAEMMLNKSSKDIRAARCNSKAELALAWKQGPNVLLITGDSPVLRGIVDMINDGGSEEHVEERPQKKPMTFKMPKIQRPMLPKREPKRIEEESDEEDAPKKKERDEDIRPSGPARPGMFGKLKDALGIIDDDEEDGKK